MDPIIKIENLSKQYRLGNVGTGTLSHDLNRWWAKVRGKEDPFLKIGETNNQNTKGESDYVWALKDINLEVMPGEVLGIIGKNGAGKSTLLKLLSRVTAPTTGSIKARGRIASLLEVGTGFHPELTGRENIFLNGAILGMTKAEIRSKFDEIVDFAGVERYIDTPVKRYSSGMYVRLAFAVAAHLEPEILVVDEVLSVGDVEFQKKAIGKMQDVSRNHGRTVLFVSHNMPAVKNLCVTAVILDNGIISIKQKCKEAIDNYLSISKQHKYEYIANHIKPRPYIKRVNITYSKSSTNSLPIDKPIEINIELEDYNFKNLVTTILIINQDGLIIYHSTDEFCEISEFKSKERNCIIPAYGLAHGKYFLTIALGQRNLELYEKIEYALTFQVEFSGKTAEYNTASSWKGLIGPGALYWK